MYLVNNIFSICKNKWLFIVFLAIVVSIILIYVERVTIPDTTAAMREAAATFLLTSEKQTPPNEFLQDGCSLFPDSLFWHDFKTPCLEHDIRYWLGGTKEERLEADLALREAIKHTGPLGNMFSPIMYMGVRIFGDTIVTKLIDANWGYGWNK